MVLHFDDQNPELLVQAFWTLKTSSVTDFLQQRAQSPQISLQANTTARIWERWTIPHKPALFPPPHHQHITLPPHCISPLPQTVCKRILLTWRQSSSFCFCFQYLVYQASECVFHWRCIIILASSQYVGVSLIRHLASSWCCHCISAMVWLPKGHNPFRPDVGSPGIIST